MDIPKRTVSFLGDSTDWRLITAKELAELEVRKPQVPAEVIAEARRWAQNLRMWPRTATPTEDGFRLIPEDCLRVCSAAFDALLAAVGATPDEEWLKPIADMTLDEQIDELATYMSEQMPVLAVLLDEKTLPKVLQSFRDREYGS